MFLGRLAGSGLLLGFRRAVSSYRVASLRSTTKASPARCAASPGHFWELFIAHARHPRESFTPPCTRMADTLRAAIWCRGLVRHPVESGEGSLADKAGRRSPFSDPSNPQPAPKRTRLSSCMEAPRSRISTPTPPGSGVAVMQSSRLLASFQREPFSSRR